MSQRLNCPRLADPFQYTLLTSVEDIRKECTTWDSIVDADYRANPFYSVDWHLAWLDCFVSSQLTPCYLKLLRNGEVAGYLPLIYRRAKVHRVPARVLGFPQIYASNNSEVIRGHLRGAALAYCFQKVLPGLSWDVFEWKQTPPDGDYVRNVVSLCQPYSFSIKLSPAEGNWVYENAPDSRTYFGTLKPDIRNKIRRMTKKLEAIGQLNFRVISEDFDTSHIADYEAVYARSWKEPEECSLWVPRMIESIARRGRSRLGFLYLNGQPIATQLWFCSQRWGYLVKLAYDEALSAYSVGTLLLWRMIEHLMDHEGMRAWDHLRGDDWYKARWASRRRNQWNLTLVRRSVRGSIIQAAGSSGRAAREVTSWLSRRKE
jgi:CelD/BcsL family acetyltransferase involved in cellulose biosynthesis